MNWFRHISRWTALLLLVNIGTAFCDCLREPVSLGGVPGTLHATAPTSGGNGDTAPACGDNCDSCVCHANLVVSNPIHFAVNLAVSRTAAVVEHSFSDPALIGITHPPRR